MEYIDKSSMLDLIPSPAFSVQDGRILQVNQLAARRLLEPEMQILPLITTGSEEYHAFHSGCLYLTLTVTGQACNASVSLVDGLEIFVLEQDADLAELQAMALSARELRSSMSNIMATASHLFPGIPTDHDPITAAQISKLNRGLYQMLRVVGNMSDAARYLESEPVMEVINLTELFREIAEKAAALIPHTGVSFSYSGLSEPVYGIADSEKLERAVYNIFSNSLKFTPANGFIRASLTRRGNLLCFTVQDCGEGIPSALLRSLYARFRREPAIEDGRFGIGLGMVLIRTAAAVHGGTVLIDQPEEQGTRITMTLEIRRQQGTALRSPIFRIDYTGDRDHALVELSDTLPAELYRDVHRR